MPKYVVNVSVEERLVRERVFEVEAETELLALRVAEERSREGVSDLGWRADSVRTTRLSAAAVGDMPDGDCRPAGSGEVTG